MFHLERSFVETAESEMNWLETAWVDGGDAADHGRTQAALSAIKSSAMTVSARGVAMAADRCEQTLVCGAGDMLRPLVTLQRLIAQYAAGLREIDTVEGVVATSEPRQACDSAHILSRQQNAAAELLRPLIKFAPANDQMALSALMRFSGLEAEETAVPFVEKTVALESLMAPVTNAVLGMAHRSGKSVSVSYAVDDSMVSQGHAKNIQAALIDICTVLVERGLQTPQIRTQSGKSRTGQIAISALERTEGIELIISGDGIALKASQFAHIEGANYSAEPNLGSQLRLLLVYPVKTETALPTYFEAFDTDLTEAFA